MAGRVSSFTKHLLHWYGENHIAYPWRSTRDPYRVWLSEILLQQTRIPVALKYYERIVERYPHLGALAAAVDHEFLSLWSGAGYYQRARNMHTCARKVIDDYGGRFPEDYDQLKSLPGIGPYTAGAIRNICHGILTPAADGNITRVLSRIAAIGEVAGSKAFRDKLQATFLRLGKGYEPAEYFQALMELGERICLPHPLCDRCPVQMFCAARIHGNAASIPVKRAKKKSSTFHWYLLVVPQNGSLLYSRNRNRQFLKDAWVFPDLIEPREIATREISRRFRAKWGINLSQWEETTQIAHAVTFRKIYAHVLLARSAGIPADCGQWLSKEELRRHPTSSIVFKVLQTIDFPRAKTPRRKGT